MKRLLRVLLACECSGRVRDEFAKRGWDAVSADLLPSETPVRYTVHDGWPAFTPMNWDAPENTTHYQGDVQDLFLWSHPVNHGAPMTGHGSPWDLVIGFPPCTDLSYAGARYFAQKQADGRQDAAALFFMRMINAPAPFVAVENPRGIMFKRYRKPDQVIQPWMWGDPFEKATCLWVRDLPLLVPDYTKPEVLATAVSGDSRGYTLHRGVTGGGSHRTDQGTQHPAHDFNGRKHWEDSEGRKNRAKVRSRTFPGIAKAMARDWGAFVEGELA